MKIAVFGGTGFIGSAVVERLSKKGHEVLVIGRRSGDVMADYTDPSAVEAAFQKMQPLDGVVVTVGGDTVLKNYEDLTDDDYRLGSERKLLSQIRVVRMAEKYLEDNGSIILTSGVVSHYPIPTGMATGPLNIAVDTFVQQVAPILKRGIRLNVVSPATVVDRPARTAEEINVDDLAENYVEFLEGDATGQINYAWARLPVPAIFDPTIGEAMLAGEAMSAM